MPIVYPQINGARATHADLALLITPSPNLGAIGSGQLAAQAAIPTNPVPIAAVGVKSVNWKHGLKPGDVYGTAVGPISRTRGKYMREASIELYVDEAAAVRTQLAGAFPNGWMEVYFTLTIAYLLSSSGSLQSVGILGCKWADGDTSSSAGSEEALTVKIDLSPMVILENGAWPTLDQASLAQLQPFVPQP